MKTYTNKIETVAIQKIQIHVAEAAVLLSTSSLTVYKLISSGKLAAHKEGKSMENKGERPGKLCGNPITFSLIYVVLHRSSYFFLIPGDGTSK